MFDAIDSFRHAIEASLGYAPDDIQPGKFVRFATNGKRGDAAGWCQLFDDLRAGVFGDFRAGLSETWTATPRDAMTPTERSRLRQQVAEAKAARQAAQRAAWRVNDDRNRFIARQARPVRDGDPVQQYLCSRLGVDRLSVPECLRLHPSMAYLHEGEAIGTWPAMLAPLMTVAGQLVAWHRTYLEPDGFKAKVPGPVKKLTPAAGLVAGASIPLREPVDGVVGVAEGVETSLAAHLASDVPTVATYSANNLGTYVWPAGVRRLVIYGDADDAGREAAAKLRERALKGGVAVSILIPSREGQDWLDVWTEQQQEVKA